MPLMPQSYSKKLNIIEFWDTKSYFRNSVYKVEHIISYVHNDWPFQAFISVNYEDFLFISNKNSILTCTELKLYITQVTYV